MYTKWGFSKTTIIIQQSRDKDQRALFKDPGFKSEDLKFIAAKTKIKDQRCKTQDQWQRSYGPEIITTSIIIA